MVEEQFSDIGDIVFEQFIHIGQIGYRLSCLVDDEAGAALIGELIDAFGGHYLHEFDVAVQFGDDRQVLVDQIAELIVILVEVQHHKRLGVCLRDLSDVLIARDLDHLAVLLFF